MKPDKRADVHPQGVGRIRSAPSLLTAALAIGPYKLLCRIVSSIVNLCRHQPLQGAVHEQDWPSIPEMSRTEIDAVCPQMRVVHLPEPKAIRMVTVLRPSGRSGRGAAKKSRASARNMMRLQAPLFFPFFSGKTEKNGPAERQLRCHRKRGSSVNPDKRAGRPRHGDIRKPCRAQSKITAESEKREF